MISDSIAKEGVENMDGVYDLKCCDKSSPLAIDTKPKFSWKLAMGLQREYQVIVSTSDNEETSVIWDSGIIESSSNTNIPYEGPELKSFQRLHWKVGVTIGDTIKWSTTESFQMGVLDASIWGDWMGFPFPAQPGVAEFFREIELQGPVKSSKLFITARGLYEAYINGVKAHDDYFGNGWTDYHQRIYYRAYDISPQLKDRRTHNIGIRLGEGWYKGPLGYQGKTCVYGHQTMIMCLIQIEYEDGFSEIIKTGEDGWRCRLGSIQRSGFLNGENVDIENGQYTWTKESFQGEDSSIPNHFKKTAQYWDQARHQTIELSSRLNVHPAPPIKKLNEIKPIQYWESSPGSWIYDLGQNFSGWARVNIKGIPGSTIRLRFGERLKLDNSLFVENLRSAQCADTYVIRGNDQETWEPSFTYHGFQYVEVTGLQNPELTDIIGVPITSDCERTGYFSCSDSSINQLYSNTLWTQWSNFIDIPTDCPQRDERLGWTGDALAFIKTAAFNNNVKSFMRKWLQDLRDTQEEDGSIANTAPRGNSFEKGNDAYEADAGWADAITGIPWALYEIYGDKEVLEESYEAMLGHLQYYKSTSLEGIRNQTHTFGDWLNDEDETPNELLQTAYYFFSLNITEKTARVLGDITQAETIQKEKEFIKQAYQNKFIQHNDNSLSIANDSQTAYVVTLNFGLCPAELEQQCALKLVDMIQKRGNRLSTGFIGTHMLLPTLSKFGQTETAYKLLFQTEYPSWLYPVKLGATSIWERWNGWTPETGPGDSNMNSYSHYAFGAVTEWFYTHILGIQSTEPGFKSVRIQPEILTSPLENANGSYETPQGKIEVSWSKTDSNIEIQITIPANTTATFQFPSEGEKELKEGLNNFTINI